MSRVLAYDQAPALAVPLRFLLVAPLLALPVAALLLYHGPALLATRWSAAALTATHLITVGFIAHSVIGALLQFLPVAAGADIRQLHRAAPWLQALLTAGTLLLAAGFLLASAPLLEAAAALLTLVFATVIILAGAALARCTANDATTRAVILGLAGLAATVALGGILATLPNWAAAWGITQLTDLHAAWGLAGWITVTVIGVALAVVPMFQITPRYPRAMEHWLPPLIVGTLVVLSLAVTTSLGKLAGLRELLYALLTGALAAFGVVTLRLHRASRRRADVSVWLWRGGMASLAAVALLAASALPVPALALWPGFDLLIGILMLAGFAMSVINAMMYKIVPFLVWLHWQQANPERQPLPHMGQIIPQRAMRWQAAAHGAAVALLMVALAWPTAVYGAGLAWAMSQLLLAINLARAAARYVKFRRGLTAPA
jgi:hypothetical protein